MLSRKGTYPAAASVPTPTVKRTTLTLPQVRHLLTSGPSPQYQYAYAKVGRLLPYVQGRARVRTVTVADVIRYLRIGSDLRVLHWPEGTRPGQVATCVEVTRGTTTITIAVWRGVRP